MEMILMALAGAVSVLTSHPGAGFAAPTAALTSTADGVVVHGALCRTSAVTARPPWGVRVELVGGDGAVLASTTSALSGGGLSGRVPGCAYYTARAAWHLSPGARIVVQPAVAD
jgi:hypothetical protein